MKPPSSFSLLVPAAAILHFFSVSATVSAVGEPVVLTVATPDSLTRNGPSPVLRSEEGDAAAKVFHQAMEAGDASSAEGVLSIFRELAAKNPQFPNFHGLVWVIENWLAEQRGEKANTPTPFYEQVWDELARDDHAAIREYLERNFGAGGFEPDDMARQAARVGYLEDFIMFNNPYRDDWMHSGKLLEEMALRPGETVLDIGSGFGFFSVRFAEEVGENGKVYALDINEEAVKTSERIFRATGHTWIEPLVSGIDDIVVRSPSDTAFFCSLYHVVYSWQKEAERRPLLESLKRSLKPGGRLYIVENLNLHGGELNACYVDPALVEAQLHHYGFTHVRTVGISPLQFLMEFRHEPGVMEDRRIGDGANGRRIVVGDGRSLIHIGSLDSYDTTERGIAAARLALEAVETGDPVVAAEAAAAYDRIIPDENFGGEYTALRWFCRLIAADDPAEHERQLADPLVRAYHDFLAADGFAPLKNYLSFKYDLGGSRDAGVVETGDSGEKPASNRGDAGGETQDEAKSAEGSMDSGESTAPAAAISRNLDEGPSVANTEREGDSKDVREIGRTRRAFLEDFILFNNPARPDWEQTGRILDALPYNEGDRIADIGCGGGYYTYRFSGMVGESGVVHAMDIKQQHLDFIDDFTERTGIVNVRTVKSEVDDLNLKETVDHAFMCSLYHIIYGVNSQPERDAWLRSIKSALRPGGTLAVVDNGPVDDLTLPYHGPFIERELIVAQLSHYGFDLIEDVQIIPQRYLLLFRHARPEQAPLR